MNWIPEYGAVRLHRMTFVIRKEKENTVSGSHMNGNSIKRKKSTK